MKGAYTIYRPKDSPKRQIVDIEQHMQAEIEREKGRVRRKIISALALLAAIYISAIVAYHFLEGWAWEDAIYFTTETITTVGYGDIVPRTYYGRLFTIPLMLVGIAVGFYVIYSIQEYGRAKLDFMAAHVEKIDDAIARRRGKKTD